MRRGDPKPTAREDGGQQVLDIFPARAPMSHSSTLQGLGAIIVAAMHGEVTVGVIDYSSPGPFDFSEELGDQASAIIIIKDAPETPAMALGPAGFNLPHLESLIGSAAAVVIMVGAGVWEGAAGEAHEAGHTAALWVATIAGRRAAIITTHPSHETEWRAFLHRQRPRVPLLVVAMPTV